MIRFALFLYLVSWWFYALNFKARNRFFAPVSLWVIFAWPQVSKSLGLTARAFHFPRNWWMLSPIHPLFLPALLNFWRASVYQFPTCTNFSGQRFMWNLNKMQICIFDTHMAKPSHAYQGYKCQQQEGAMNRNPSTGQSGHRQLADLPRVPWCRQREMFVAEMSVYQHHVELKNHFNIACLPSSAQGQGKICRSQYFGSSGPRVRNSKIPMG